MADNQQYGPLANKQTSASDIRSVIANATKKSGAGMTIATKDELNTKKADKQTANTVKTANIATNKSNPSAQNIKRTVVNNKGATITKINPQQNNTTTATKAASLTQGQLSGDLFKNPALQPIKDIPIVNEDGKATKTNKDIKTDMFINSTSRANELKTPIDIDNALMDLYQDVNQKVHNGTIASSDIAKLKQVYQEFSNMDDETVLQLVGTMASMAKKNLKFNDTNMKKLKSLFPELTSAAWGFDKQSDPNMYQAGGVREQISAGSATDLNKYGAPGMVAESVMNPVGEATTLADTAIQSIPQVDSNTDFTGTKDLQAALKKLTKEDINNYYKQYLNYVQEHPYISQLYTTTVEGDNLLEQLDNIIPSLFKEKTKDDLRSGFRSWLIDRINNEVNGWSGEFWGAANELKGNSGPNVAKMYANMPASTVKTVSAVTRALTNPIDTAAGLVQLFGTEEGRNALAARYGSWDAFAKAMEQDPVGVASDALAIVEGGAGATKFVAGASSKGALAAALATETLGATRSTESLLKLASRLEYLMTKAEGVEKLAGLSSNLGADIGVKGGNIRIGNKNVAIKGVINGLKEWGENGDSLLRKAAKYSGKTAETGIGEIYKEGKEVVKEGPINTIANKLMGSASDSDKLFKAASPNLNTLRNNVDYKNKRNNMDIATNAIVEAGYVPKTLSEWAKAHTETLTKKWDEFKQLVADKADVMVDVKDIIEDVRNYIKSEREGATELQKQDLRKLEVEVDALARQGKLSMEMIEKKKEHYNSSWRDVDKLKVGDVYLRGLKMLGNAMRKQQDNILGKGPESTKKLRKEIAALMDTKNDVIKADVRNQKKKSDISGGGLVESYGRLSGLGDVIGGVTSGILGGKGAEGFAQAGKGLGKMVLGKAMGKAKDVDYLTQKGFEGLSKKKGLGTTKDGGLRSKVKDRRELGDLLVERDKLKKELKNEKLSEEDRKKLKDRFDDVEYAIAQKKARSGLGDKEEELNAESKKKVIDMVQKRANDVGFTTKVLDGMEKDTQGYTDLRKKLIALEKNPGDTTAQHELFHAFFSVVDDKTKTYILDEAKKILKDSGMADKNAEEWLAESFGIYAKRKQIKLGLIDAPKGFVAKIRDFFQRVYEYMQRFNGDRVTINKLFDEVLGDRQMKSGIMDLSELLGDKEVKSRELYSELGDNGLRKKSVYHGSPADFDKFDSSHMGEGEGAQAHGWGHYVAVEERTGRHYAEMKGEGGLSYKGKSIEDIRAMRGLEKPDERVAYYMMNSMSEGSTFNNAKERYKKEIEDVMKSQEEKISTSTDKDLVDYIKERYEENKQYLDALNNIKESDIVKEGRNLYSLDIPDLVKADTPTGKNYLEEKELMSADATKKFIEVFGKEHPTKVEQLKANIDSNGYGRGGRVEGWEMYVYLEDLLGSPKAASKFLESIGYDGIHYFGGQDGEAYVLFNDNSPKIKNALRYKKVYHGGGDFDKFDLSHVGEGEGNDVHGHGIYLTENKQRAKEYGDLYRDRKYGKYYFGARNDRFVTYKGKKMSELRGEENEWMIKGIMHGMQEENNAYPYYDAESQIAKIRNGFRNQMNVWAGRGENIEGLKADYEKKLKALDSINPKDFKFVDAKRNLYDVEIPDPKKADTPTLTNYLEEGDKISNEAYKLINKQFNKETGLTMKRWSKNVDGKEVYDRLSEGLGSKGKASEFLKDMGYDGIHYIGKLDGSSYVLFNDKTPQIKNSIRYKKGLTAKDQTQTPEFKKWFEGSKVVDKSGKPMVVYHGTPNEGVNIFDRKKIGTSTDSGVWGRGFYFTPDKDYAKSYTKREGKVGELKEAYVDIKKPFEIELNDKSSIDRFNEYYMGNTPSLEDVFKKGLQKKYGELVAQGYEKGTQSLRDAGYDGVIVKEGGKIKELVAFDSNQIKSATDNIGTFDKNNPDIRYKKGLQKKESGLEEKDVRYKTNKLEPSKKAGKYFDNLGEEIDEGTYKLILTYNKLLKKYFNSMNAHNYNAQYDLLDQLNGVAHRIKDKTKKYSGKANTTYEDYTYPLKNNFAKSEVNRRGPNIITYDENKKRYSITKPNGKKGGHLDDWVGDYANSKK